MSWQYYYPIMSNNPLVSVFIPVYNRERYILEAINSVLQQSFKNFEILVIDDGSTDDSVNIIKSINDKRIRLICNSENLGIPQTRNRGLIEARGKYIAILDSDDIMLPNRLKEQVKFLEENQDYVGVGSWSKYIDGNNKIIRRLRTRPIGHEKIKTGLLFHCCIHNRTFTAHTSILKRFQYDNSFSRCQDYELLTRLSKTYKLHNLPKILVYGRKHGDQVTKTQKCIGDEKKIIIAHRLLDMLNVEHSSTDLERHIQLGRPGELPTINDEYLAWMQSWLMKIMAANKIYKIYNQAALGQMIFKIWLRTTRKGLANRREVTLRSALDCPIRGHFRYYFLPPYL